MRIVSPTPEASLSAIRLLSETAINNPPRKNLFTGLIPVAAPRASLNELPPLVDSPPEKCTARRRLLFAV